MAYHCEKCGRPFRDKYNLQRHTNRKRSCQRSLPGGGSLICLLCGSSFAKSSNLQRHASICRAKKQTTVAPDEIDYLRTIVGTLLQHPQPKYNNVGSVNVINNNMVTINVNITINNFGEENTEHITDNMIKQVLIDSSYPFSKHQTANKKTWAMQASEAICHAAMMIYSDPDHPENITCYRQNSAIMVKQKQGWSIFPDALVIPPMAEKSISLLFDKQPHDEDSDKCTDILKYILNNEKTLLHTESSHLKTILLRNKDILQKAGIVDNKLK